MCIPWVVSYFRNLSWYQVFGSSRSFHQLLTIVGPYTSGTTSVTEGSVCGLRSVVVPTGYCQMIRLKPTLLRLF